MRSRWAILAASALLLAIGATPAFAAAHQVLAQPAGDDTEVGDDDSGDVQEGETETEGETGDGGGDEEISEGQSDAEAETGAGEGTTEEAETETGPPWTYQMARIILALLVVLALSIGWMYWKLIAGRQKGAA